MSVYQQISDAIFARLQTVPDSSASFPSQLDQVTPADKLIVLSPQDTTPSPEYSCQGNPPAQAYVAPYQVICYRIQSNTDTDSIDSLLNPFAAEVLQTLCGVPNWYTWGDLAIDTRLGPESKMVSDDAGTASRRLTLNVFYRVSETDPTIRR